MLLNADISTGLMLLAVGMTTVFSILALVVLTGNTLIRLVNRYAPLPPRAGSGVAKPSQSIHPSALAAIVAAVDIVTKGKGKVDTVEKAD